LLSFFDVWSILICLIFHKFSIFTHNESDSFSKSELNVHQAISINMQTLKCLQYTKRTLNKYLKVNITSCTCPYHKMIHTIFNYHALYAAKIQSYQSYNSDELSYKEFFRIWRIKTRIESYWWNGISILYASLSQVNHYDLRSIAFSYAQLASNCK
jgi:hypothetical protein